MRDGWVWTDEESTSGVLVMGWDDEDEGEEWEDDQDWEDEDGDEDEELDEEWDDEEEDEDWEEWEEEFEEDEDDPLNKRKPGRPKWD